MKKTIISLLSLAAIMLSVEAFAQQPPMPTCLTNLDIYCTDNNHTSISTNGTTSAPTNEVHGLDLLNPTGNQDGVYLNFYGTSSSSDQTVAVIVYSCNDNWCGAGHCAAGSHEVNITLPAGCDHVSGYIGMMYGNCCAITWNPRSCNPCTVVPEQ
jgi:hypothetical protein